jgi:hypothetical protein
MPRIWLNSFLILWNYYRFSLSCNFSLDILNKIITIFSILFFMLCGFEINSSTNPFLNILAWFLFPFLLVRTNQKLSIFFFVRMGTGSICFKFVLKLFSEIRSFILVYFCIGQKAINHLMKYNLYKTLLVIFHLIRNVFLNPSDSALLQV